jgi:hypothetical protein
MSLQTEKLELVQAILNIDDVSVLKEVKQLLNTAKDDWFDGLTDEQQQSVKTGLEQADKGQTISHKEAIVRLGL